MNKIRNINFHFAEIIPSLPCYVEEMAKRLGKYPIEEVLTNRREWKPELINQVMCNLTPQNSRVHVIAKAFEYIATGIEPWYKTKFRKKKISSDVIEKWNFNSDVKLRTSLFPPNPTLNGTIL